MQEIYRFIDDAIEADRQRYTDIADQIWDHPETRFEEFWSAEHLASALESAGFTVTRNVGNIPNAFIASFGQGKPVIALLGEYDALAGLSQQAGCAQPTSVTPGENGHGCGHNLLGTAAFAAAIAVKKWLEQYGQGGTVRFYGCPGEEGGSGKTFMVREGVFDDVDAALTWHPEAFAGMFNTRTLANIQASWRFKGIAAHAANSPHLGRSALDAVTLMTTGTNFLNEHIIEKAAADGIHMILTCDNGIAAIDQIAEAKKLGMTVVVTDHHDIQADEVLGEEIVPPADAIVNPKRKDSKYPFSEICGAMVAYKLIQVLFEEYGIDRQEWLDMLELAAIATVGDVMKLKDENRIVVKEGLKKLANTKIQGLVSLMEKNTLDPEHISAYHVGFVLGPCLNASGRLKTAQMAMELLLAENKAQADELADALKALNDERKDMTKDGTDAAIEQVETELKDDKVLVVFLPDCHESLAGIVAGRIREYYNKPVFVLTRAEGCAKGSGRSIEAYHMFHALVEVKDLLLKFGGHPMAAGFSLEEANIEEFRRRLNENAAKRLTEDDFIPRVWIDVPMPFEYITESLIRELELLEPFGQGNEKPQFALKSLKIRSARVFGRNRNVVKLSLMNERGFSMDGVVFTEGDLFMEEMGNSQSMDIIYYPTINEYNGNRSLQLVVKDWKFH